MFFVRTIVFCVGVIITGLLGLLGKMADDVNQLVEDALNTIVKLTDQSGIMKKELKNQSTKL